MWTSVIRIDVRPTTRAAEAPSGNCPNKMAIYCSLGVPIVWQQQVDKPLQVVLRIEGESQKSLAIRPNLEVEVCLKPLPELVFQTENGSARRRRSANRSVVFGLVGRARWSSPSLRFAH